MNNSGFKDFLHGCRLALPIGAGYIPLGFACGVVCSDAGMTVFQCALMSLLVYAGAGQYIAGGMIASGASPLSIIITIFIVNGRHILYTSALYPYIAKWSIFKQSVFAAQITDEVFAMQSAVMSKNDVSAETAFGINMLSHFAWIGGNILGAFSSGFLPDSEKFGLDFTLYALFIALILPRITDKAQIAAALASGVAAVIFALHDMAYIGVVIGAVAGASIGYFLQRRFKDGDAL